MKKFKRYSLEKQLELVRSNGHNIRHIHDPSLEVQLEAVKRNGCAIQYIHDPSLEVQIEAVKRNGYAIQYIHEYHPEIAKLTDDEEYLALAQPEEMTLEDICNELGREIKIVK